MHPHLDDTIVALSTTPGPGARAIVRLSGSDALRIAQTIFQASVPLAETQRRLCEGHIHLPDIVSPLPADLYFWPAPKTYTGQEMVELHTISSPPLVDLLIATLLNAGARAAQPGEFTVRAFLAGKLDLTRAEAVLAVIEAGSRDELKQALAQLAGNVARPLQELRDDLLNLLADVEAGLDFADEDIHFVGQEALLRRIAKGMALVTLVKKQIDQRSTGHRPFRVAFVGRPNAGKSSLFNTLSGASALVSEQPGTTRDYLVQRLEVEGVPIELIDTAGLRVGGNGIDASAQALGREQAERADLLLLCVEPGGDPEKDQVELLGPGPAPAVLVVATKGDLAPPSSEVLATSAVTRAGLAELRRELANRARAHARPALAPSLSRCRHHVDACLAHLRQAHSSVLNEDPPELLAVELRGALDQLGEMVGAVYTDDLLDRIFSRFCIGK
jgi:tRNA modification GTPase